MSAIQQSDTYNKSDDEIQYVMGPLSLNDLNEKFPGRPRNRHRTLPFHELITGLFNPLNQNRRRPGAPLVKKRIHGSKILSSHEQRSVIIKRFISRWRSEVGDDFFPALRLILPDRDRDRPIYGLKEKAIAKLIIKVLRIDRRSEDALSLLNWRLPIQKSSRCMAGDFVGRCNEVLSKRSMRCSFGDMRIAEVNQLLNELSAASTETEQVPIFEKLYMRMNAEEMTWIIRIVLREMRIGASEKTILDIWHSDGEALFNVSSNLKRVCWELTDPMVRLESEMTGVTIMEPFQPQLAQFNLHNFQRMILKLGCRTDDDEFWIEEKLDGERMQLHMTEDHNVPGGFRFSFWSRKGKDYTHLYGQGFEDENSALTRFIRGAFDENIRNIILDGEMITWDPETNKIVAFGTLKSAARSEQQNPYDGFSNRPLFRVFDCLYINDRNITQYVLKERHKVLERAIKDVHQRIEVHKYKPAKTVDQIEEELRKVVAESSEGLVLKNPRSAYELNSRNNNWIKVKPEYMTGFGESLDCIVIGGYFGRGHRAGGLASFLCGLRVDKNHIEKGANPMKCYSFFKVGGGFSALDYATIRQLTDGKWIDWDEKLPPSDFIVLGGGKRQLERPDKWIKPEDSLVLEVKATSICASESFGTGFTLRFPRFKRLRDDKSWEDSLSIYDFLELKKSTEEELEKREFEVDRRSKKPRKARRDIIISGNSSCIQRKCTSPQTKIFEGLNFCVMSEMSQPHKKTKGEIEQVIKKNGGSIFQNPMTPDDIICISDKRVVRVASLIQGGQINIIKPIWIFDVLKQSEVDGLSKKPFLLPLESRHLLHATQTTKELAKAAVDINGDSYTRDVTIDELKHIMADINLQSNSEFLANDFISQLQRQEKVDIDLPSLIFRNCKARFVSLNDEDNSELRLTRIHFLFAGGEIITCDENEDITHYVLADNSLSLIKLSRKVKISQRQSSCIVTIRWLSDCWAQKKLLDEKSYMINISSP